MTTRNEVRARLVERGIRLKRGLGQSFLVDDAVLEAIAEAAVGGSDETVVEIGAGIGTLTARLAVRARRVVAIERDRALIPLLTEALASFNNVTIIEADALKTPFAPLGEGGRPRVAGNLPYSITSPLLLSLLEQRAGIGPTTVMIQREVALRLAAGPGSRDYGSLSVLFQLHAEVTPLFDVPPECFLPSPEVHSTVLALEWLLAPRVSVEDPIHLERVVRAAFSQRRKTLRNALTRHFGREIVLAAGEAAALDLDRRAETLALEELAALARHLPG